MEDQSQQIRADQYYLPIRVNEPMMVIFWDIEQVRPLVLTGALGIPFDAFNYSMMVGIIIFFVAKKVRARFAKGIISHMAWWVGLLPMKKTCSMPDPLVRELFR